LSLQQREDAVVVTIDEKDVLQAEFSDDETVENMTASSDIIVIR
jgi:hypothetical protein